MWCWGLAWRKGGGEGNGAKRRRGRTGELRHSPRERDGSRQDSRRRNGHHDDTARRRRRTQSQPTRRQKQRKRTWWLVSTLWRAKAGRPAPEGPRVSGDRASSPCARGWAPLFPKRFSYACCFISVVSWLKCGAAVETNKVPNIIQNPHGRDCATPTPTPTSIPMFGAYCFRAFTYLF